MARPKKQVKLKEPIKIRLKSLADGNKSIYLDIYYKVLFCFCILLPGGSFSLLLKVHVRYGFQC